MRKKIFIGAAWPYANGSLHLGHVAALIGADILARYFRSKGDDVLFVSGSDCHGTPIAFEADKRGVKPNEISQKYHQEFIDTLVKGLDFSYDLFTATTTDNHAQLVQEFFLKLYKEGYIYAKTEELSYCSQCNRFLPDRYIEGECPICHFSSARGDQCDECGNLIDPKTLINPKCKICGSNPIWKPSEHFFLKLSAFQKKLTEWIESNREWRPNAKNFSLSLLNQGLHDRAITRDTDWGVAIPLDGYDSKRIYVWFEAVCGYLSASKEWAKEKGDKNKWEEFWQNEDAVHFYVHGKDNIPFHTIIWPAILIGYENLHLPDRIISSEYLTLEGKQFSKSRKWAVWLPDFLSEFDPETLRYFLISSGLESSDSDFSWKEYEIRTNTELIGNFGNFIHRVVSFIKNNFPEGINFPTKVDSRSQEFLTLAKDAFIITGKAIEEGRFREALKQIFKVVEHGNRYINDKAPWVTIKNNRSVAESDLAVAGHIIKCLAILTSPFLPKSAKKISTEVGLDYSSLRWAYPKEEFLKVEDIQPLYEKIEDSDIESQLLKFTQHV